MEIFLHVIYIAGTAYFGALILGVVQITRSKKLQAKNEELESELAKKELLLKVKTFIIERLKAKIEQAGNVKTGFPFNEAREAAARSILMGEANQSKFIRKADAL